MEAFQGSRFQMKRMMLQMLQIVGQFGGTLGEDLHTQLKSFIETCNTFVFPNITVDEIHLTLFPFSLRDEVRQCAYSFEPGEVTTWNQMIENFMKKFFPTTKNAKRRRDIANFQQKDKETLSDAWARFKRLVEIACIMVSLIAFRWRYFMMV